MKEKITKYGVVLAVIVIVVAGIKQWEEEKASELPVGLTFGNGRIEAEQVDVAAKYSGRIKGIVVDEGDLVKVGDILVRMDTMELEDELAQAEAHVAEAREGVNEARAMILQRESQLSLAETELKRALLLVEKGSVSRRTVDQRQGSRDMADAGVKASKAHLRTIERTVQAAEAAVHQIETRIQECYLKAPVDGRVLYRLAEEGEVIGGGGKVLTILDLSHIYMEIFLPARDSAKLDIGSEARIVLDAFPEFALPAMVEFISPEAQFTPKQVETQDEREKLMFRVKLEVPKNLVLQHLQKVKTGVRGIGYVKMDKDLEWPKFLQHLYYGQETAIETPVVP